MSTLERARQTLAKPGARRWAGGLAAMAVLHLGLFVLMAGRGAVDYHPYQESFEPAPIYVDLSPLTRRPAEPPRTAGDAGASARAPFSIRRSGDEAAFQTAAQDVAPLVLEPGPPDPPARAGRVVPRSWRERCGLPLEGVLSDADIRACEQVFLSAATNPDPRPQRRGDPAQDFAAQGAARIAAFEAQRAPGPVGGGNAGPSSAPGGNFGMGDIRDSVIYLGGSRPPED